MPIVILFGPEPHLASCQECGATLAKPDLPMPFPALAKVLRAFGTRHKPCQLQALRGPSSAPATAGPRTGAEQAPT